MRSAVSSSYPISPPRKLTKPLHSAPSADSGALNVPETFLFAVIYAWLSVAGWLRWADLIQKPVRSAAGAVDTKSHLPQWGDVIDLHVERVLLTSLKPDIQAHKQTQYNELFSLFHTRDSCVLITCLHSSAAASPLCCRWPRTQTWRSACLFQRFARPLSPPSPHKWSGVKNVRNFTHFIFLTHLFPTGLNARGTRIYLPVEKQFYTVKIHLYFRNYKVTGEAVNINKEINGKWINVLLEQYSKMCGGIEGPSHTGSPHPNNTGAI